MAEIHCPICNRMNDTSAERCWYCQTILQPEKNNPSENKEDWLNNLRGDSSTASQELTEPDAPQSNEPTEEDTPDWLARIRLREQEEHSNLSSEEPNTPPAPDEEVPDWLNEIQSGSIPEESPLAQPENSAGKNTDSTSSTQDNDEWLKKLESWQPVPPVSGTEDEHEQKDYPSQPSNDAQPEGATSVNKSFSGDESDWLQAFMDESANPELKSSAPEPSFSEPNQEPKETPSNSVQPAYAETHEAEKPAESSLPEVAPDETSSSLSAPEKSSAEPAQTAISDEEPDWLSEYKALKPDQDLASQVIPPAKTETTPKAAFDDLEIFDWMSKPETDKTTKVSRSESEPENESEPVEPIEQASLPPWLQALRPAKKAGESTTQNESLQESETSGPLAGIEGALQGDAVNQFYTHPEIYGENVKITDNQKIRSQILKNIVEQSRWEDQELAETPKSHGWILRLVVCILLLVSVILPSFFQKLPTILPTLYAPEVVDTFNGVNALSTEKPILVAADFDGSLYGELSISSQTLFEHLMERNIAIASLSTTPVGAPLLQEMLDSAATKQSGYLASDRLINLGYLPGGSMGLQALAADPRLTMPLNANLQPAWQTGILKNIRALSDFGALIVITENADTARYWIEQVRPTLETTPLYVVISAQSAPLLQPYYDSKQINGYIAGMISAATYEQLANKPGLALEHYPTYQITLLLVTLIIFMGGVIALVTRQPFSERARASKS